MENKVEEAAIIGMGPAGCSAAIYLKRSNITPFCFEQGEVGGKLNEIKEIENYPSFVGRGSELSQKFKDQIAYFKIPVIKESVRSVTRDFEDNFFIVKTDKSSYKFKAVIIASGIMNKPYEVKGSKAYNGNGISRCAECDAPFHKGKPVAVIGNSSEAVKDALYLASLCHPVYLINPEEGFTASSEEVEAFKKIEGTEIFSDSEVKMTYGEKKLSSAIIVNKKTQKEETIQIEGLFIFLGATPLSEFLGYMDVSDEKGQIKTDDHMRTSEAGLFACGDDRNGVIRQVISAVNDGGIAAISARGYLSKLGK